MSSYVKFIIDENTPALMESFVNDTISKPVSYYGTLDKAIETLKNQKYGTVEILPSSANPYVSYINARIGSSGQTILNMVTYSTSVPTGGRPVVVDNQSTWLVGDVVYNADISNNSCRGWICTSSGSPGTWKEIDSVSSQNTDSASSATTNTNSATTSETTTVSSIEQFVGSLPEANEKTVGTIILYSDNINSPSDVYYCNSQTVNNELVYSWTNLSKPGTIFKNATLELGDGGIWNVTKIDGNSIADIDINSSIFDNILIGKVPSKSYDNQIIKINTVVGIAKYSSDFAVGNDDFAVNDVVVFKLERNGTSGEFVVKNVPTTLLSRLITNLNSKLALLDSSGSTAEVVKFFNRYEVDKTVTNSTISSLSAQVSSLNRRIEDALSTVGNVSNSSDGLTTQLTTSITNLTNTVNYNKAEANSKFAPLRSPDLTGTPTAPTPTVGDASNKVATTEFVKNAIATSISISNDDIEAIKSLKNVLADSAELSNIVNLLGDKLSKSEGGTINGDLTVNGTLYATVERARKLAAPRSIKIADAYSNYESEAVTFDGSGDITLKLPKNITAGLVGNANTAAALTFARKFSVQDNDGTNKGNAVDFNGTDNVTMKLPATIKANLTGNADTATRADKADECTGNAATATILREARSFQLTDEDGTNLGQGFTFNGSDGGTFKLPGTIKATIKGNADTATSLKTARKMTVSDSEGIYVSSVVTFDGTEDVDLRLPTNLNVNVKGNADTATTADKLKITANFNVQDSSANHTGATTTYNGTQDVTLKLPEIITATLDGNATTATTAGKLANAKTFIVSDSSGTNKSIPVTFDGTGDVTLTLPGELKVNVNGSATKATYDNANNDIANTYLRTDIARETYAPLNSPELTGTPKAPTPAMDDSSDRIATTQFVEKAVDFLGKETKTALAAISQELLDNQASDRSFAQTMKELLETKVNRAGDIISGDLTVTGAIKGTADVALTADKLTANHTINIQDADGAHTGASTYFNGTQDGMIRLPATIKATVEGQATSAINDDAGNNISATYIKATTAHETFAPLISPALTGVPTATTANAGDNTTRIATTAFVTGAINTLNQTTTTALTELTNTVAKNNTDMLSTVNNGLATKINRTGDTISGDLTVTGALHAKADTAIALATGRDVNVVDADGTNAGEVINFDGTKNISIKLPAIIKATLTGQATSAVNDSEGSNIATTYLKSTVAAATYAPIENPTFTGQPLATTADKGDSTKRIATTEYVMNAILDLVQATDSALAAIQELNEKLASNAEGASSQIALLMNEKVSRRGDTIDGNLTVKGSLHGNADTALALYTKREFSIQDQEGANSGEIAQFDGTSNIILKLPRVIKAEINGAATSATNDSDGNKINSTYLKIENATRTYAPIESPELTGTPLSVTPDATDNSKKIATTEFVQNVVKNTSDTLNTKVVDMQNSLNATSQSLTTNIKSLTDAKLNRAGDTISGDLTVSGNLHATADKATALAKKIIINIKDNESINVGADASFDGTENISLRLPSTIKANLAGKADTATADDQGNSIVGTYLSIKTAEANYAKLVSPELKGEPTSPTPAIDDNSTKIATTAFVTSAIAGLKSSMTDVGTSLANIATTLASSKSLTDQLSTAIDNKINRTGDTITGDLTVLGKLHGNADTASALAATRSIAIVDDDGSNKGTAVGFNGSTNIELVLPPTIKATLTGQATSAVNDNRNRNIASTYLTINDAATTYAPLNDAKLTGLPEATTAVKGDSTNRIATTKYVMNAIADLVNSTNAALESISSLAESLSASTAGQVTELVSSKLDKTGGTITGNLTVNGTLDATANKAKQLANTTSFVIQDNSGTNSGTAANFNGSTSNITLKLPSTIKADVEGTATKAIQDGNGNNIISTYLTKDDASSVYATKVSPVFTGTPTATTPTTSDNSNRIATTAFVKAAIAGLSNNTSTAVATTGTSNAEVDMQLSNLTSTINNKLDVSGGTVIGNLVVNGNLNAVANKANQLATPRNITVRSYDGSNPNVAVLFDGSDDIIIQLPSTITATLNGTASAATRDSSNNVITNTYATKTELTEYANLTSPNFRGAPSINGVSIATTQYVTEAISEVIGTSVDDLAQMKTAIEQLNSSGNVVSLIEEKLNKTGGTITGDLTVNGQLNATISKANALSRARDFVIRDNSGSNTGTAVAFDGSGNVTLTLPSTIKANLDGLATSATNDSAGNSIVRTYMKTSDANRTFAPITSPDFSGTPTINKASIATVEYVDQQITTLTGDSADAIQALQSALAQLEQSGDITSLITNKFDKSGGTVTGDATFDANVTVNGTLNATAAKATELANGREFIVQDNDGTNSGSAVMFNGTNSVTLKLPSIIKATIDGSATKATSDGNGNVIANTYLTKNNAANTYAPLESPNFTGTPTINNKDIATVEFVNSAISEIAGTSSEALAGIQSAIEQLNSSGDILTIINNKLDKSGDTVEGDLTVSGSLNANASSATKLAAAKNFSISDRSNTNSGDTVAFDGTANVVLKLPATIKADLDGTAANATRDASGNVITSTYLTIANAGKTYAPLASPKFTGTLTVNDVNVATVDYVNQQVATLTGSSAEALAGIKEAIEQLNNSGDISALVNGKFDKSGGTVTGNTTFNKNVTVKGTLSGNATSAVKLATARTIAINDSDDTNKGTGVAFDGTSNIIIKLPATIKATINGLADKATKDASGNVITSTYLTTTNAGKTYAPLKNPVFTGTPKIGTAAVATTTNVTDAVNAAKSTLTTQINAVSKSITDNVAALNKSIGTKLNTSGGTITGNLTVKGTFSATVAKANALTTPRNFTLQDNTGANSGTAVAFDGSGNAVLKLPAKIKATLDGVATKATSDGSGNVITSTYLTIANAGKTYAPLKNPNFTGNLTVDKKLLATQEYVTQQIAAITGKSAEQLANLTAAVEKLNNSSTFANLLKNYFKNAGGTVTGNTTFNQNVVVKGTLSGNATSAVKLATARNLSINDKDNANKGATVAFDGTKNIVINLPAKIKADIDGTAANATRDASGNVITSTYLTIANAGKTYAPLASPKFTGTPTSPTPAANDNSTKVATTAFVGAAVTKLNATITAVNTSLDKTNSTLNTKFNTAGGTVTGDTIFNKNVTVKGTLTATVAKASTLATARNFSVSDNYNANKGAAVSFNGGADVVLKLPAKIKADLDGTAAKATSDASGRNIVNTYALKSDLSKYAPLAAATFTGAVKAPNFELTQEGGRFTLGNRGFIELYKKDVNKCGATVMFQSGQTLVIGSGESVARTKNANYNTYNGEAVQPVNISGTNEMLYLMSDNGVRIVTNADAQQTINGQKAPACFDFTQYGILKAPSAKLTTLTAGTVTQGATTITDNTTINKSLTVKQNIAIGTDITSVRNITASGSLTVNGNLTVKGSISAKINGTVDAANKLTTARTISVAGGAGVAFDGTKNININLPATLGVNISGLAAKATNDASNRNIVNTYATKAELGNYAAIKNPTFSNNVTVKGSISLPTIGSRLTLGTGWIEHTEENANGWGSVLSIQAGHTLILGSGESVTRIKKNGKTNTYNESAPQPFTIEAAKNSENLHLLSDNSIILTTNCDSSAKIEGTNYNMPIMFKFSQYGYFYAPIAKVDNVVAKSTFKVNGGTLQVNLANTKETVDINYKSGVNQVGVTGVLPVNRGGTGGATLPNARKSLFGNDMSNTLTHLIAVNNNYANGGVITVQQLRNKMGLGNTTGALPVANGGTGRTDGVVAKATLADKATILANTRNIFGFNFNGSANICNFATTAGSAAAFTAAVTGLALTNGATVTCLMCVANSANATLNVNGTGAKPIFYRGAKIGAGLLVKNGVYSFVYYSNNWHVIGVLAK